MSKLNTRPKTDFPFHSRYTAHKVPISYSSFKQNPFDLQPFDRRLKLKCKFLCRVKEKKHESNVETQRKVNGYSEDLGKKGELENASGNVVEVGKEVDEVDFHWDWPPWKNLPKRYKLIGTTSLAFVICNMDKVNLSVSIIPMSHQFGWSSSVAGLIQSSFFWGYALSQLPGGWLAKIFGGRRVLGFGVLIWSIATAMVPLLAGFTPALIASRILVGIGEGVSPSAATDLIARHV